MLKKELSMSVEEAVPHIVKILEEEGFTIFFTKGLHEMFKKKFGIDDFNKYVLVVGCHPNLAKMALEVSLDVGLVFPCSFIVYELEDKTMVGHVSIMKTAKAIGLTKDKTMDDVIKETGKIVHKAWDRF